MRVAKTDIESASVPFEIFKHFERERLYELTNHLGNFENPYHLHQRMIRDFNPAGYDAGVLSTVSHSRIITQSSGTISNIEAVLVSYTDYYPFGSPMPERQGQGASAYRYGFNGKEEDPEGMGGGQSTYDYGFRIYNPALGRFLSVDPAFKSREWISPYNYVQNNPINRIDPNGALDEWVETAGGEIIYDNRVINQSDAEALYGKGSNYLANGSIVEKNGKTYELGDFGFFKENGEILSSRDMAESSLAYTNPEEAAKQAFSEKLSVYAKYATAVTIRAAQGADVAIPEVSDLIPVKWVAHAVIFLGTQYLLSKMEAEIAAIERRAGGKQGQVYSLRAQGADTYVCYKCASGEMFLNINDVWKYGESTTPDSRYTKSFYKNYGVNMKEEGSGNQVQIKVQEKRLIYGYFILHGHLPPGNKIFR